MDEQIQRDGALGAGERKPNKRWKEPQRRKKPRRKGKEGKKTWVTKATNEAAYHTFFDIAKIDARVSHLPQVHEVGCSDPVGQSLLMSVSKVPIGACRAEGRDGVSLRSFSTKVWTLCPVSCRSILGHRRGSKDEPDQEV